jgi:hypothetical protein
LTRAASAALASPGPIAAATSAGVVPSLDLANGAVGKADLELLRHSSRM